MIIGAQDAPPFPGIDEAAHIERLRRWHAAAGSCVARHLRGPTRAVCRLANHSRLPGEAKDTSVSADGSGDAIPSSSWQRSSH